jgi:glucosylceramidase
MTNSNIRISGRNHSYQQEISMTENGVDHHHDDDEDHAQEHAHLLKSSKTKLAGGGAGKPRNSKRLYYFIVIVACCLILLAIGRRVLLFHFGGGRAGGGGPPRGYSSSGDSDSTSTSSTTSASPGTTAASSGFKKAILYRSICEYYNRHDDKLLLQEQNEDDDHDDPMITVIESSMTHPSQSWQEMVCFPSSTSSAASRIRSGLSSIWNNNNNNNKQHLPSLEQQQQQQQRAGIVNEHGAPDAVLLVNFSQPAFSYSKPILGFGGAFTEASALNYNRLPTSQAKDAVMELLFGKTGLGYRLGRLHINSCDFSLQSYSFDETVDDFDLIDFDMSLQHDVETGVLDMAQRATAVLRQAWSNSNNDDNYNPETSSGNTSSNNENLETTDGALLLFASPWSPPSWMKKPTWQDEKGAVHAAKMTYSTEPSCLRQGVGKNSKYAKAWALYFSKYITAVQDIVGQGRPLWAVTVQNEPEFAAPWEACSYTKTTEAEFVAHHLGPRLQQDHPDTRLFVFDHNKDHVNAWMNTMFLNTSLGARPFVDGTAYHWYAGGMDRLLDGALGQANMHRLQENLEKRYFPNDPQQLHHHVVLGSESCHCPSTAYAGGDIRVSWARAERYAHVLLADLAAGSQGWLEWNLILDGIGGPNHLHNLCESTLLSVPHRAKNVNYYDSSRADYIPPLPYFETDKPMGNLSVGDERTREELNALGFPAKYLDLGIAVQPMYYYMGHISRHVRPGAMAVMAILTMGNSTTNGRIFRPPGQVVMGGGVNDLAKTGIELTLWPCEGSTRQQFYWNQPQQNEDDQDMEKRILVKGHDWLGRPTMSCIGRQVDMDLKGLRLTDCITARAKDNEAGEFNLVHVNYEHEDYYKIYLMNHPPPINMSKIKDDDRDDYDEDNSNFNADMGPDSDNNCLIIKELANNGGATGPLGGAQLVVGNCLDASAVWKLDSESGEVSSMYFVNKEQDESSPSSTIAKAREEVCFTTGWPFLQAGAFLNPNSAYGDKKKTIVVLNEANDAANLLVQDEHNVVLTTSIPPRSIQTFALS